MRARVAERVSAEAMVADYARVYQRVFTGGGHGTAHPG
jgi:hypothetical protein